MAENCMRTSISVSDYHTGIGHRNANLLLVNQTFHFWDVNYHTVTHYIQKPTVFCSHILPSGYQTWQRGNHQFIILSMILFQLETSIFSKGIVHCLWFTKGSQPGSTSSSHCGVDGNSRMAEPLEAKQPFWMIMSSIAMSSHIFSPWFISMYLIVSLGSSQ